MLPTLSQLRLGNETGVTLDLVNRPKGKASDDRVASGKRQALREVENPTFLSTTDPKPALQALITAFRTGGSAERAQWKAAVNDTMDRKIARYKQRLDALQKQIVVEHKGVQEFISAADENLKDRAISRSGKAGQAQSFAKGADDWELAQEVNSLWKTLLMEKAAIQRLEEAAKMRKENLGSGWDEKCEALADAIEQPVLDFPNQVTLLETFRHLITGFLKNSETAEDYQTNYILMGNAGVGKTRIARLIGDLLGKLGIFVFYDNLEVARDDFVAQYEGQTAPKTRALLASSVERVIFLDEAYSLTTYDKKESPPVLNTYSAEAISEILTFLSNNVGCSCFIAAGYENQMMNDFLEANEGLDRRFNQKIWLDDYEPEDLLRIYLTGLAESLGLGRNDGKTLFTSAALRYFEAIFAERKKRNDAGEYEYPILERMFHAQAGAALTLVSETKLLLFSARGGSQVGESENGKSTYAIGPEDVKKILESRMEKSIRRPQDGVWELLQIAACSGVFSAETNRWKLVTGPDDESSNTCEYEQAEIGTKRRAKAPERLTASSLTGPATVPYK